METRLSGAFIKFFLIFMQDSGIKWDQIIEYQYKCLKNGLNEIGIPGLIIAQNAKQNHSEIYSLDNHFILMKEILSLRIHI
jgi:hypothetical protein